MSKNIPKVIWMFWDQGLSDSPEIVKSCYRSWVSQNPDWEVIFIDSSSIYSFFDAKAIIGKNEANIDSVKKSNLLRMNLLSKYGGVWADATCFCSGPLSAWLYNYAKDGFFVFRDPAEDRILSNWFIVSSRDNFLTQSFCEVQNEYFSRNLFSNQKNAFGKVFLSKLQGISKRRESQDIYLSRFSRKILRVYPYFIFHYLFASHIKNNSAARTIFESMEYVSADEPH